MPTKRKTTRSTKAVEEPEQAKPEQAIKKARGEAQPQNLPVSALPLTPEIWKEVFSYLPFEDLARSKQVCKQFKTLAQPYLKQQLVDYTINYLLSKEGFYSRSQKLGKRNGRYSYRLRFYRSKPVVITWEDGWQSGKLLFSPEDVCDFTREQTFRQVLQDPQAQIHLNDGRPASHAGHDADLRVSELLSGRWLLTQGKKLLIVPYKGDIEWLKHNFPQTVLHAIATNACNAGPDYGGGGSNDGLFGVDYVENEEEKSVRIFSSNFFYPAMYQEQATWFQPMWEGTEIKKLVLRQQGRLADKVHKGNKLEIRERTTQSWLY